MLTIPSLPIETNWPALENCEEEENCAKSTVECNSHPNQSPDALSWKNPQIEEQNGKFQKGDLCEVKYLHNVEHMNEVRDLFECNSPNVCAEAVRGEAVDIQHRARYS